MYLYIYIYSGPDYPLGKVGKCVGPTKVWGLRTFFFWSFSFYYINNNTFFFKFILKRAYEKNFSCDLRQP